MNISIRTYVRTPDRLQTLTNTINQFKNIGYTSIQLIDGMSPMRDEVKSLCTDLSVEYHLVDGISSVINGFYHQLMVMPEDDTTLICCDDILLSSRFKDILNLTITEFIPSISEENWGIIGFFAPSVDLDHRSKWAYNGSKFIKMSETILDYHPGIYFGLIANILSPIMIDILKKDFKESYSEIINDYCYCEDRYCTDTVHINRLSIFNTKMDYVQHVGDKRSFDDSVFDMGKWKSVGYRTEFFIK